MAKRRDKKSADKRSTHTKHLKLRLIFVALVLALILPALLFVAADALLGTQYDTTYYAVLPAKLNRLNSVSGPKIIVIGGSATAFGIDEELVEEETGMPCVAFGLYAAFGLKCMLKLSEASVGEGDIIVIAPEYSTQMFSDYVGYDELLQAAESGKGLMFRLGPSYFSGLFRAYPSYLSAKKELKDSGGVNARGVYTREAFDENGRIRYTRDTNIMDLLYSPDNLPEIAPDVVSADFLKMINDYTRRMQRKGATVTFGFVPVNRLSVEEAEGTDTEGFVSALQEGLICPVLSDLGQHIMDERFFYDSNFHMNDTGMVYNTVLLIEDLKRMLQMNTPTSVSLPYPPDSRGDEQVLGEGDYEGFRYALTAEGVTITGLDDIALQMTSLTVPDTIENARVRKIDTFAFRGASAQTITLPDTIRVLSGHLFEDCPNLRSVILQATDLPEVGDTLMEGAPESAQILVPEESYGLYLTDYFWARYASRLAQIP